MITRTFYFVPLSPFEDNANILKKVSAISSTGIHKEEKICVWIHRDSFRVDGCMKDGALELRFYFLNKHIIC